MRINIFMFFHFLSDEIFHWLHKSVSLDKRVQEINGAWCKEINVRKKCCTYSRYKICQLGIQETLTAPELANWYFRVNQVKVRILSIHLRTGCVSLHSNWRKKLLIVSWLCLCICKESYSSMVLNPQSWSC